MEGQSLRIINDHDPKPLCYQFEAEQKGRFEWEYEQRGPKDWIVKIKRLKEEMGMNNQLVIKKRLSIILKAQKATDNDLKLLRGELIEVLDKIGPKRFVTVTAEILKRFPSGGLQRCPHTLKAPLFCIYRGSGDSSAAERLYIARRSSNICSFARTQTQAQRPWLQVCLGIQLNPFSPF